MKEKRINTKILKKKRQQSNKYIQLSNVLSVFSYQLSEICEETVVSKKYIYLSRIQLAISLSVFQVNTQGKSGARIRRLFPSLHKNLLPFILFPKKTTATTSFSQFFFSFHELPLLTVKGPETTEKKKKRKKNQKQKQKEKKKKSN